MASESGGNWMEYQRLVLSELERHGIALESLSRDIAAVKTEIALLKLKSGLWGAIAGMIPVIVVILVKFVR